MVNKLVGSVGLGRLAEPETFVAVVSDMFKTNHLSGSKILITAGPTQEPIDPVRYVGNRSSGLMGYCLASVAAEMSAIVTLVSGPTALPAPKGVSLIAVNTARQMFEATLRELDSNKTFS